MQQTLLEIAFAKKTDIITLQEPSVWLDRQNKWFSINHAAYTLILPTTSKKPRTATYIRIKSRLQFRVREDLIKDNNL